ncbi:protocatechuate 3,4-dioxygenase subunit alpha [Caulobacter sp.]|uniref:protocatechuate 3,4-dioxygenase subunit alpha n=1 Tax=Caulobacter sp. TaxID=78 RepID=UPI001B102269|nr:protocatechuate 3,4-dioxygenase subunit alpha [Caulobacter sp.]MBO9544997.1 protocatechuate 3,4-dioxygenase subunit alpha [Caulobacter sp.]
MTNPAPRLDNQDPALFGQTPSQTVGPFFHYGLPWKGGADLVGQSDMGARPELFPDEHYVLNLAPPKGAVSGEVVILEGVVTDADGKPVPDAMIEIWQANAAGQYASPDDGFIGFGRASTSDEGLYRFKTILPGPVPGPGNSQQAPHIAVSVFGRGVIKRLATRVYFDGAPQNAADPILALVPPERRDTLIARQQDGAWRFDIVLQGERETVFFDI